MRSKLRHATWPLFPPWPPLQVYFCTPVPLSQQPGSSRAEGPPEPVRQHSPAAAEAAGGDLFVWRDSWMLGFGEHPAAEQPMHLDLGCGHKVQQV